MTAVTLAGLGVSLALCLYRLLVGPDVVDRVLALDTLTINVLAVIVVLSIHLETTVYFESVLVLAVLGFVATVSIAKYLMRGQIID